MKAVGVRPTRGDFALPDARIIKPGDPYASTLVLPHGQVRPRSDAAHRFRTAGRSRTEAHRAVDRRHEAVDAEATSTVQRSSSPDQLLAEPEVGLAARAKTRPRRAERRRARRDCWRRQRSSPPVRFATCSRAICPADEKGERKLGSNPRPKAILAHQGDSGRGEKLFWSEAVNCGKCHRVGERGTAVGPDLSTIGKLAFARGPAGEPPVAVAPHRAEVRHVSRADRRTVVRSTGLLVKRDENAVVLRDGQGKEIVLPTQERAETAARRARR